MSKQIVLAMAAGTTAFAAVVGSAATIGGVTSDNLGADATIISSCDTNGVSVDYTTALDATLGEYEVTGVTVSGIAEECEDQAISVALLGASAELTELTSAATEGDGSMDFTVTDSVLAEAVTRAAVVISGPEPV